jgi:hypothetical protein
MKNALAAKPALKLVLMMPDLFIPMVTLINVRFVSTELKKDRSRHVLKFVQLIVCTLEIWMIQTVK